MDIKKLLPIGSVVRLKNAKKDLMIIGIKITDANNMHYDYISVIYPEGYINRDIFFKFNHEDIGNIYFEGFKSEERESFLADVKTFLEKDHTKDEA